jgi:glucans biosynthesis protein C
MSNVSIAPETAASQVRPAAVARPKAARLAYLDTLRVILICLVMTTHTAITYGAAGGWPYHDPAKDEFTSILLTLVTGINQSFFMGLFFFVSGYFTPGAYDRKGGLRFWKDRLLRLAIPLILYTWLLNRVPNYFAAIANGHETRSFLDFTAQTFWINPEEGPTWFLFSLLVFSLGYTLWRLAVRLIPPERFAWINQLQLPGAGKTLLLGLVIAVLMFVIGLAYTIDQTWDAFGIFGMMVIFYPQYILFYIVGVLAYRSNWMARLGENHLRFWGWLSLGLIIALPVIFVVGGGVSGSTTVFIGGPYWQSAVFMLWVGFSGVAFSMTLIAWLRDRARLHGPVIEFAGANTFGAYLFHPLILVPLSYGMSYLAIFPLIKFVIVLAATILLSFLVSGLIRRVPGVKAVL